MEDNKTMEEEIQTSKQVSKQASKQHQRIGVNNRMGKKERRGFFYREKRSRGIRVWTNHQPGHGMPLGGVGRGWGYPLPPSLMCPMMLCGDQGI